MKRLIVLAASLLVAATSCTENTEPSAGTETKRPEAFAKIVSHLRRHADAIVLPGHEGSEIIVSPKLQGRIMTAHVGTVASTGFVPEKTIEEGETHAHFNNFGGIDRFWIGPEAGQYGVYFPPGAEFNRDTWQVPASFDKGAFRVVSESQGQVSLEKSMEVTNYGGVKFQVNVQREIGTIPASQISGEIGLTLPKGVAYVGCYSDNVLTNTEDRAWDAKSGLIGVWILSMFAPSPKSAIIAPFNTGDASKLGPEMNDEYFGKVSKDTPDRIAIVDGKAVVYRGDSSHVGKFGLSQARTTGIAGAYDFTRDLLTVVKFTVPKEKALYGNSTWVKEQKAPYGGDAFQSYNNGDNEKPGTLAADPFFEIESASPVKPLKKGESIRHRHAIFHFQGKKADLAPLAEKVFGVSLDKISAALKF
ncbi:MAG: DUF6786 family protein [Planctomycetota bacterium]